ncbi:hypothetical protein Tco_1299502 [Tanacetum coccineum]
MSQTAFRLANYIIEKEEFGDIVKAGWTKSCDGHDMFKLVNKLKAKIDKEDWLKMKKICDVKGLRVLDNDVPHEKDQVGVQFITHFEKFLGATSDDAVKMDRDEASLFNKIDASEAECMSKEVTEGEIKNALFDIEDDKALQKKKSMGDN